MARARKAAAFPRGTGRWSVAQANALLRAVEGMFHRRDIDALVNGFTPDCWFHFAEQPPRRGRAALRRFFTARLSRQVERLSADYAVHVPGLDRIKRQREAETAGIRLPRQLFDSISSFRRN